MDVKHELFWVLSWGVLDGTVCVSLLLGCLVSSERQAPLKVCYFRWFYHTVDHDRTHPLGSVALWLPHRLCATEQHNRTMRSRSGLNFSPGPVATKPSQPQPLHWLDAPSSIRSAWHQGPVPALLPIFFFCLLKHFTLASKLLTTKCRTCVHVC
jgi:hypothetical protein